jgi:hypothetical protein
MNHDEWMVPEIRCQCSSCYRWYDARFDTHCPQCGSTVAMSAASLKVDHAWWHRDCPGKLSSPHALTVGEQRDCDELDRLYAKEDKR